MDLEQREVVAAGHRVVDAEYGLGIAFQALGIAFILASYSKMGPVRTHESHDPFGSCVV